MSSARFRSSVVECNCREGGGSRVLSLAPQICYFASTRQSYELAQPLCLRCSAACEKCLLRTHSPPSRAATAVNASSCWWPPLALGAHTSLYMHTDEKERRAGSLVKNSPGSHAARRQDGRRWIEPSLPENLCAQFSGRTQRRSGPLSRSSWGYLNIIHFGSSLEIFLPKIFFFFLAKFNNVHCN